MRRREYTNVNDFITAIVINGGWNWVSLKYEFIDYQKNVNNKITFTKWFKKHLKEMYAFEGEIKKTELMKLIESK